eukprot:1184844-Prorocentrum_minimum.AAC.1
MHMPFRGGAPRLPAGRVPHPHYLAAAVRFGRSRVRRLLEKAALPLSSAKSRSRLPARLAALLLQALWEFGRLSVALCLCRLRLVRSGFIPPSPLCDWFHPLTES